MAEPPSPEEAIAALEIYDPRGRMWDDCDYKEGLMQMALAAAYAVRDKQQAKRLMDDMAAEAQDMGVWAPEP